jgi:hypothetical protein
MKFRGILTTAIGLLFAAQVNAQSVQDTFMGMKLGTELDGEIIIANVGARGEYQSFDSMVSFYRLSFKDTYFAGHKWSFAYFYQNTDIKFYEFTVSDYYSSSSEAEEAYNSWKKKLDEKYSPTVLSDDYNEKCICYYGDNGVDLLLTYEYSKSKAGIHYYYVSLNYIHEELYFSVQDANNDEL